MATAVILSYKQPTLVGERGPFPQITVLLGALEVLLNVSTNYVADCSLIYKLQKLVCEIFFLRERFLYDRPAFFLSYFENLL